MGGISMHNIETVPTYVSAQDLERRPRLGRLGRTPAPPVDLPDVDLVVDKLAVWVKERAAAQRTPEQTAKILALAVMLHEEGKRPWPTRKQVPAHLGVSQAMVDVVLSKWQASKDLQIWTRTGKGNIKARDSIITLRYVRPSKELVDLVNRWLHDMPEPDLPTTGSGSDAL